ncbi:MAG: nucleotidyltransferase domain-containing protein [Bacteroidetes bacterium]|nr:MAG: nucleotidyltransferase domain-containing protein [Bacteroidota bacterium]
MQNPQQQFELALQELLEKLRQDHQVVAVILFGSLSHDRVWEKSDIDLMIITRDLPASKGQREDLALTERDLNIHAVLQSRSSFKKLIEGSLQSSFMHATFAGSRLLFTRDPAIEQWYHSLHRLGEGDRRLQLFHAGSAAIPLLYKAQKFLIQKNDPLYSFIWVSSLYAQLAKIEVFTHGHLAGREVIHQALELNPPFFDAIYTQLLNRPKTPARLRKALNQIDHYLSERSQLLFQPLLDYLQQAGVICPATHITHWAQHRMNLSSVLAACEWLADKGVIHKTSAATRLTPKSLVEVEELAFYYET